MSDNTKYYGKYRGTVLNNVDPQLMGRIQVLISDFTGVLPSNWAMPCAPIAGIAHGWFAVPVIGSGVWVEFERGDSGYPIWVGGYWGSPAEVPPLSHATPPAIPAITISTPLQNSITISDLPGPTGGIVLMTATGASISINETGIIIQNGQGASIVMAGPTITINDGALVIV